MDPVDARKTSIWITAGAAALVLVGVAGVIPLFPIAPYSFVIVIPAFLVARALGGEYGLYIGTVLGSLLTPIAFFFLARHIARSGRMMPNGSVIAFAVLGALSLAAAVSGWDGTVEYQSLERAMFLVALALLPPLVIALAGIAMRKGLTLRRSLTLHWAAFAWLTWSAFPWYGELI